MIGKDICMNLNSSAAAEDRTRNIAGPCHDPGHPHALTNCATEAVRRIVVLYIDQFKPKPNTFTEYERTGSILDDH